MTLPRILRCQHVLCLPCLVTYFLDYKQVCPICNRDICLQDAKRLEIESFQLEKGFYVDMVLLKKDMKTYNVELADNKLVLQGKLDNFLERVKSVSNSRIEELLLKDLEKLHIFFQEQPTDNLIQEMSEFLQIKDIERINSKDTEFDFKGRKAFKHKISKQDSFFYLYQIKQGFNVFLHPLDAEYLFRQADNRKKPYQSFYEVSWKEAGNNRERGAAFLKQHCKAV